MRLECINNIKENEILAQSILDNNGEVLLKSGVTLTQNYICKLRKLGVYYIYIEDDRLCNIRPEDREFTELKQSTIKSLSDTIKNISFTNDKEIKKSMEKIECLVDYILDNQDINKCICDIKTYDNYTYIHCLDTSIMATFLALSLNIEKSKIKELAIGSILHDVGKTRVPYNIINKRGKLTEEEFKEVKKHPIYGKEILQKRFRMSDIILNTVIQHHERVDGTGYPYGLTGDDISKYGKIIAICDVYDAVSTNRSYRKKFSHKDAYEFILSGSGSSFDSHIVNKFKNTFSVYPLGVKLKLSNNIEGYVCAQNKGFPDRPVIRVFNDQSGESHLEELDLLKLDNVDILGAI